MASVCMFVPKTDLNVGLRSVSTQAAKRFVGGDPRLDSPLAAWSSQVKALRCTLAVRIAQPPIALCRFRLYVRSGIAVRLVNRARLSYDVRTAAPFGSFPMVSFGIICKATAI